MAQLIFSTIGQAVGSYAAPTALRAFGAAFGQAAGSMLGRAIDQRIFGETRKIEGPRLTDVHLQGGSEGASIPAVYGRARIAGQVIWAARFKERKEKHEVGGGGGGKGGGSSATRTDYVYSLSFAIGLCEGEIARIGGIWANGDAFDGARANMRVYLGGEDQAPDPLIEAIEGEDAAPAFRGLAYVVFEDLPLADFGNVIPQMSFEIVRPAPAGLGARLEEQVQGVCLIPGSGEFVYATQEVRRKIGPGQETPENVHVEQGRANLLVTLDQLQSDLPNCKNVLLVTSWFGNDLRAGSCAIRPGVEIDNKATSPISWRAGGVTRSGAHLVSLHDGAPAFGGTPADATLVAAIQELKARGFKVGLYPFLLMDIAPGNGLVDPYGGDEQAAYPWRGRITPTPEDDQTAAIASEVAAFFGAAAPADFSVSGDVIAYAGPSEWSFRRFILHNAKIAAQAGGVDFFILGSELRGLTAARDSATSFPAVTALRALAADVRAILGASTKLTYAADWSEYFGHQPSDGSGDAFFHLDPLWADSNVDCVGIDWYPPLTDWRDGPGHLDSTLGRDDTDPIYLQGRIEAGENYDYYYASGPDRIAQTRTPISDGAYGEPWIYRAKDVRNFWARAHYDRPGGVRSETPTAWVPQSKPIWFVEIGCPAIDKGANAPNLFIDNKSDESAAPPFSSGARDDLIQRRTLEAYLTYWVEDGAHNPSSSVDGRAMLDPDGVFIWAWDARPHPAFPARDDVWSDGGAWRRGHWLNGRAGLANLSEVARDLCARAGVDDVDASALAGAVSGYIVDSPATPRAALEPLMAAFDFFAREREGALVFAHRGADAALILSASDFAAETGLAYRTRGDPAETPIEARVAFVDAARDYAIAHVSARRLDKAQGGVETLAAPLVLEAGAAEFIAERMLADARAAAERFEIALGPAHLALEPGDLIAFADASLEHFEIERLVQAETLRLLARRAASPVARAASLAEPSAPAQPLLAPTPAIALIDAPPLLGAENDERPLFAAFAEPWHGAHELYLGSSAALASLRASASAPAIMGELAWALWPGPVGRRDQGNRIRVKLYGGALESVTEEALLNGANAFAVEGEAGEWEILQARDAVLVGPLEYELSCFLRGQQASAHAMGAPTPVGARIVKLDERLVRANIAAHEWNGLLRFAAPPWAGFSTDPRAETGDVSLPHAWARPWPPAHVRAERLASGDVALSWVRRARLGDHWGPGEPPLNEPREAYRLEIYDGETLKRAVEAEIPAWTYPEADQIADFGGLPGSIRVKIGQIGADGQPGLKSDSTMTL